jgi:hypothetical protein
LTVVKLGSYDPGMMKQGRGKLRLSKESLRVLSNAALARVNGGTAHEIVAEDNDTQWPNFLCVGMVMNGSNNCGPDSQVIVGCTGTAPVPPKGYAGG